MPSQALNRLPACRPPSVKCVSGVFCAPPRNRPSMASTTWSDAARPKRASHACGIGSAFSMVPIAEATDRYAPEALLSASVNVSPASSCASSSTGTEMVLVRSPGSKVSVPDVAV